MAGKLTPRASRLGSERPLSPADAAALDKFYPPCGPCAFCRHPDKRHRFWDAIMGAVAAGDTVEGTAHVFRGYRESYKHSLAHVKAVLRIRPYQSKRRSK